ncbi:MAG: FAD-binding protein [Coriobacteriales bacterium]|jgi:fumarate reductase flavoprotein subunit|nr:FAD-binding protein [Coriobacteriales bacterium]
MDEKNLGRESVADNAGISRRGFLAGAASAGALLATASLTACAPNQAGDDSDPTGSTGQTEPTGSTGPVDYKAAPAPIGDDQIAETITADVVIIGAGCSGAIAMNTLALEEDTSVIVLQKEEAPFTHGYAQAYHHTKAQIEAGGGYLIDPWDVINYLNRGQSNNRAKMEVMRNWVNYAPEVGDWMINKFGDREGFGPVILDPIIEASDEWNYTMPVTHLFLGTLQDSEFQPSLKIVRFLVEEAVESGKVDIRYKTPAKQLRTDDSGRVIGVIGENEAGEYILAQAGKGVIICAGDYGNNPEMRKEYLQHCEGLPAGWSRTTDTGDGILMGYWAGGHIQDGPHCTDAHYDPGIAVPDYHGTLMPWLRVNIKGERFSNEDQKYDQLYAQDVLQPECCHFQVFDAKWENEWQDMGTGGAMRGDWTVIVPTALEKGDLFVGETLEELAASMSVPVDTFVATVARYNELCEKGFDADFGKQAARMKKVEQGPFYAFKRQASVLCSLSGLSINEDLQVLDADDAPIAGLYAAGNSSGDFFGGLVQDMSGPGFSCGRAFLTGRIAAWRVSGKTREQTPVWESKA